MADTVLDIHPIKDYGFFEWTPGPGANQRLKSHGDVTYEDIESGLRRLRAGCKQDPKHTAPAAAPAASVEKLVEALAISTPEAPSTLNYQRTRLPMNFKSLPPSTSVNRFPNAPGYAASIVVAMDRGLCMESVDFMMGGSALDVFSQGVIDVRSGAKYFAQRVGKTIVVAKHSEYMNDFADVGHQFERLVTGGSVEDTAPGPLYQHLQTLSVGPYTVLFSAEVDAVDEDGKVVEVKSGNPRYFGTKLIWQMVSSGAKTLVRAEKRGMRLLGIKRVGLDALVKEQPKSTLVEQQRAIIKSLGYLKEMAKDIPDSRPVEITFDGTGRPVVLTNATNTTILPSKDVMSRLLCQFVLRSSTTPLKTSLLNS
jgi:hypothetical protein